MDAQFKPFHDTYRITTYSMTFGMVYPNPATDKWRLLAIPLVILTILPLTAVALLDIQRCWCDGNYLEVIRHVAMFAPFTAGFNKMFLLYYKRGDATEILDTINRDYASYNNYSNKYKTLVKSYINNTLTYHRVWLACVLLILSSFVVATTLLNMYEYLFRSEPQRHMIYDINLPYKEPGTQLETPYFEIMYFYMLYVAIIYCLNFNGYDGFMIAALNHACLRIELFCKHVDEAMEYQGEELRTRMANAIKDQCEIYKLIKICQSAFNGYLGMTYLLVTTELCVNLYLITEGFEFDYQFTAFSFGTILHIYVPCQIADKLKHVCADASVMIYSCGWENMNDLSVRRYIPFMIARSQQPVTLKAFGIITYQMELFVATLKTAYSMYTLIKK